MRLSAIPETGRQQYGGRGRGGGVSRGGVAAAVTWRRDVAGGEPADAYHMPDSLPHGAAKTWL